MILICPACATRYRVTEQEFEGSAGRTVRCANCGHIWYERAPPWHTPDSGGLVGDAAADPNAAPDKAAIEGMASPALGRLDMPPRMPPVPAKKIRRAWSPRSWAVAIVVVLLAVAVAAVLARRQIAAIWPSAMRLSTAHGLSGIPSETGLVIRKIAPSRTAGGLVIDGEIANLGNAPRDVPRLRVGLQDGAEKEIQSEIVDPPKARLSPGETVHFETPFAHPPDDATGVVVTFASS